MRYDIIAWHETQALTTIRYFGILFDQPYRLTWPFYDRQVRPKYFDWEPQVASELATTAMATTVVDGDDATDVIL